MYKLLNREVLLLLMHLMNETIIQITTMELGPNKNSLQLNGSRNLNLLFKSPFYKQ
jgi:hypothetical protein